MEDQIQTSFRNLEKRVARLEGLVQGERGIPKLNASKKTLPEHILELRVSGFFAVPRTGNDVHRKLGRTYPCEPDRVMMALLRLAKRRELRKASKAVNGQHAKAYVA